MFFDRTNTHDFRIGTLRQSLQIDILFIRFLIWDFLEHVSIQVAQIDSMLLHNMKDGVRILTNTFSSKSTIGNMYKYYIYLERLLMGTDSQVIYMCLSKFRGYGFLSSWVHQQACLRFCQLPPREVWQGRGPVSPAEPKS
jgi:hypothetical protein